MSGDLVALLLGTALGVGAIAFVLYPLFFGAHERMLPRARAARQDDTVIQALREIEFDRATGKLSDADYAELRRTYATQALRAMRNAKEPVEPVDLIEARVRAYRATHGECATCGLRPEEDATYCSTCGSYLQRACPACHAPVPESAAGFCSACGEPLNTAGRT